MHYHKRPRRTLVRLTIIQPVGKAWYIPCIGMIDKTLVDEADLIYAHVGQGGGMDVRIVDMPCYIRYTAELRMQDLLRRTEAILLKRFHPR